jgi:hypothetical protein
VFAGGRVGAWQVERVEPVTGPSLPVVERLAVLDEARTGDLDAVWALRGMTSNARYTQRNEQQVLAAKQAELGRPEATCAALIPITKSLLVNDVGRFACGDVGSNLITTVCRAGHESGLLVVEE